MTSASTRGGQAFHVRPESATKGQAACSSCKMPSWYDLTSQPNSAYRARDDRDGKRHRFSRTSWREGSSRFCEVRDRVRVPLGPFASCYKGLALSLRLAMSAFPLQYRPRSGYRGMSQTGQQGTSQTSSITSSARHHQGGRQLKPDRPRRSDIKFLAALGISTLRKCNKSVPPANLDGTRDSVRWWRFACLPICWLHFNCKWQFCVGAAKRCGSLRKVKNVDPRCGRGQQASRDHQITGELEGGCASAPRRHRPP
jgi:hypothetical protein